jgi:glycosyltransferase involved in cell wall biosynthesis
VGVHDHSNALPQYGHRFVMPRCAIVSFRLGHADGVSVVAETWADSLRAFGFDVVTVAGDGPVDIVVPGLAIDAAAPPSQDDVRAALRDVDLVVVENLLTIPLNLPASRVLAHELRGRPALLHHHDPRWQRDAFAHVTELPIDDPAWRHVTINELTRREFAARGIDAVTIYNGFDPDPPPGDREATRNALGITAADVLVAHPVRAIPRKNVPAALALTEALGGVYWLLGPPEDGYEGVLADLLGTTGAPVIHRAPPGTMDDAYAAADLVAFPSTWEGFGNPPVEASLHRRPVAVGNYPVADELRALGFDWFAPDDVTGIRRFLRAPDRNLLDRNAAVARDNLSLDVMARRLHAVLAEAGWLP